MKPAGVCDGQELLGGGQELTLGVGKLQLAHRRERTLFADTLLGQRLRLTRQYPIVGSAVDGLTSAKQD